MLKRFLLLAVTVTAFLCACAGESTLTPSENPEARPEPEFPALREITLSAYSGDAGKATKTSRNADGTFFWSTQDRISLFYGAGDNGGWELSSTNSEPSEVAEFRGYIDIAVGASFEGAENRLFWGVYPYSEENQCDGTLLTTRVPNKQVSAEWTFSDGQFVSIGCSDGLSMGFYNLCGGIKFTIERPGVRQIILRGNNNEPLAGLADVIFDEYHHPVVYGLREEYTEITLYAPNDGCFEPGIEYFIVILPVTFENGFTVEFDDGFTRVVDTPLTINRSKFQWSEHPLDYEGGSYDLLEYTVIDDATKAYLEEFEYDNDYGYSRVTYYQGSDDPLPLSLTCDGASSVWISTSSSFMLCQKYTVNASPIEIYNLVPGVKYYYRILDEDNDILQEGAVKPVGPLRWIHGVVRNVRDLGGWNVSGYDNSGNQYCGTIKYGRLYRGREIDGIGEDGMDILINQLGVSLDLDLRGYNNNGTPNQVLPVGYENIQLYQFLGNGTGSTEDLYKEAIRIIINELDCDGVIYFHCIGGADRTGTLAFLIEALLGVSESDLSKDFELTTYSNQQRLRSSTGTYPFRFLIDYLRSNYPGDTMQEIVTNWATNGPNALSPDEIEHLRILLLDK